MSPFSQTATSSAPASNPFAPRSNPFAPKPKSDGDSVSFGKSGDAKLKKRQHPLAQEVTFDSDEDKRKGRAKHRGKDPFVSGDDTSGDDSRKNKGSRRSKPNANGSPKPRPVDNASAWNGAKSPANTVTNQQPFSSGNSWSAPTQSNDPHSKKVFEQLHKDNIHPPQWPSQPGDPASKVQMARFREQYEAYRDKVRASLTKSGLIDDPEKRKTLRDAIDFKGICEDMCPEYEKIQRITELDVHQPEKDPKTTFANTSRMVKKLARSAAGQEAPLPMDVRSVAALRRTLDYLVDELLRNDGNLPVLHGFLWDRTRAIRRDFTFFSSLTPDELLTQVYVLENIARFHVTALHLLSQEGVAPEDFVEQQELEQLGKALLSLRDLYDDCDSQGITCKNEAEFRAYYLVFHANDPNILETLQRQWRPSLWRDSDEIRTAVSLVEALQNTDDFHGPLKEAPTLAASGASHAYFRIMKDPSVSYTMACFAECHLPHLRRGILKKVKKALARPKETTKDVTATVLNRFLHFDTIQQAIDFAELHNLEFSASEENPMDVGSRYLLLNDRAPLPHPRISHQFSQVLVESKRGSASLPKLIHESLSSAGSGSTGVNNAFANTSEQSLFVKDKPSAPFAKPASSFSQPTNGIQAPSAFLPSSSAGLSSPFSKPDAENTTQKAPAVNPFAPKAQSTSAAPSASPFALKAPTTESTVSQPFQPSKLGTSTSPFATQEPSKPPAAFGFLSKTTTTDASTAPSPSLSSFIPTASNSASATTPAVADAPAKSPFSFTTNQQPAPGLLPTSTPAKDDGPETTEPSKPVFSSFGVEMAATSSKEPSGITTTGSGASSLFQLKPVPSATTEGPTASSGMPSIQISPPTETPIPPIQTPLPSFQVSTPAPAATQSKPLSDVSQQQPLFQPAPSPISQTTPQPPLLPPQKPQPPRDLLGDFTKWFVLGDDGLLEQFQTFTVENLVAQVFQEFQAEEEERIRREEEEHNQQMADEFRARNLSIKYFYLWKQNARERRLRELRRSGREQFRAYHEAQRTAKLMAQEKAARQAAKEKEQLAKLDRIKEMRDVLGSQKLTKRKAQRALLASGVLAGVENEQEAVAAIVGNMSESLPGSQSSSRQASRSPSESRRKEGAKTRALREMFHPSESRSLRRSLPSMSSRHSTSSRPTSPVSRASERWRLKAMGIVQMADGTAVPESLANSTSSGVGMRYSQLGYSTSRGHQRRASTSNTAHGDSKYSFSTMDPVLGVEVSNAHSLSNKRKRTDEEEETDHDDGGNGPKVGTSDTGAHKRIMSEAEIALSELRAMRAELEEGTAWFKTQNEKLRGEIASRGSTPWRESM